MNMAFVCAKEDEDDFTNERHTTSFAMVRCPRCGKHAVGGYWCDTCGHTDVDPADQLAGHGEGKCEEPRTEDDHR
jgi:hypothetical protein